MARISQNKWASYKSIIQNFLSEDAGLKPITWLKSLSQPLPFGEDVGLTFLSRTLNVLVSYNINRTWPINIVTSSGELDNETCCLYISNKYLSDSGYLDSNGYFEFDRTKDRFIIDGIIYKASGDTQGAQSSQDEILTMVILKRLVEDNVNNYTLLQP